MSAPAKVCLPTAPICPGYFRRRVIRHTVRPHGTNDWLLIFTEAGEGLYRFPCGEYRSRPGDVTLYRPGAFHDYQFSPEAKRWNLLFAHFLPRSEWEEWMDWPELAPGLMLLNIGDADIRKRLTLRLKEMVRFYFGVQSRRQTLSLNALEEALLWCDAVNPRQPAPRVDYRVRKAVDFIAANFHNPFSEDAIARAAGLSPSRLRHLFRVQIGESPREMFEKQRLRRAENLLAFSRQSVAEIAAEIGYASPFYFSLRFKKHSGESPSAFRQRVARDGFHPFETSSNRNRSS